MIFHRLFSACWYKHAPYPLIVKIKTFWERIRASAVDAFSGVVLAGQLSHDGSQR